MVKPTHTIFIMFIFQIMTKGLSHWAFHSCSYRTRALNNPPSEFQLVQSNHLVERCVCVSKEVTDKRQVAKREGLLWKNVKVGKCIHFFLTGDLICHFTETINTRFHSCFQSLLLTHHKMDTIYLVNKVTLLNFTVRFRQHFYSCEQWRNERNPFLFSCFSFSE